MEWTQLTVKTRSGAIDLVADQLTVLGFDSFIIDDQEDFHEFLEQNRQYWDYVDEALEQQMSGLSQIRLYLESGPSVPETVSFLRDQLAALRARYPSVDFGTLAVELADVGRPRFPALAFVELVQVAGEAEIQEVGVANLKCFPGQPVGREVVDLAGIGTERAAVQGEEPAQHVVGNEQKAGFGLRVGFALIPGRQAAVEPHVARAQHPQPAVVNQQAARFVHHGAQRGAGRDLHRQQRLLGLRPAADGQHFHRVTGLGQPALHQRPGGVGGIDEFS